MMFAYLDPGSATLFWQLLLSALGGVVYLFWMIRKKTGLLVGWVRQAFQSLFGAAKNEK